MKHQDGSKSKYCPRPKDTDGLYAEWIDEAEQSLYVTGNPCFIVSALGMSAEVGWYPPDWVLDYLAEKFEQFEKDQFHSNLNVLLGFTRGRGRDGAYSAQMIAERDEYIMGEIFDLRQQSRISIKKAAQAVADYYGDRGLPFPYNDLTKNPLSAATLENRYEKEKWEQYFEERG